MTVRSRIPLPGRSAKAPVIAPDPVDVDPRSGRGVSAVIGDCAVYADGQRQAGPLPVGRAGEAAQATDGFVWIGLQQPSDTDIAEIADEFGLPPLAVEDAVKAHQRPKLEVYDNVVFVVLKPVDYIDHDEVVTVSEIALFIGAHFVVTVRHGNNTVLRTVRHELDHPEPGALDFGAATVLYRAADLVVDGYEAALAEINVDIDEIEELVFGPGDDDHAERIYKLKQEVGGFKRAVGPLARPLEMLANSQVPHMPADAEQYFRDVQDHLSRAADEVDQIDRQLTDVLQANSARVTTGQSRVALRQNEDTRKISAWAAIALVPTAIAGIYGMNFDNMPELHERYGYFVVLAIIVALCIGLYWMFRRRHWL